MTSEELNNLKQIDVAIGQVVNDEILKMMGKLDKCTGRKKLEGLKLMKTKFTETLDFKPTNVISVKVPNRLRMIFCVIPRFWWMKMHSQVMLLRF